MKNRRERAKQVRRRKVANLAAMSRKYTVNNCTIPKLVDKKAEWYEDQWYVDMRDANEKRLKELKKSKIIIKSKTPWYMITKVPSISKDLYNKTVFHRKGKAWYMEQLVQHKLAKWEKKNPCPVIVDNKHPDLFEQEYRIPWEEKREVALERIRDFVVSVYDKLEIVGYSLDKKHHRMKKEVIAHVKDIDQKGHNVNYPQLGEEDKLYKEATKIAQKAMKNNPKIIDCGLRNHTKSQMRPLIHAKRSKFKIAA